MAATALLASLTLSCARKALVTDTFPSDFYEIPPKLTPGTYDKNPTFIVIGDSRPGWRAAEKFARRESWATWWMLAFPFYQVYWLGNGVVGGVNYMRSVPDFGHEHARRVRDDIYAAAGEYDADFIVHLGDFATNGRRAQHWSSFVTQYKEEVPVALDYPLLPVAGNHEMANDSLYGMPNYQAVFSYPTFYTVACPDVDLIVVDSDIIIDQNDFIDDDVQDRLFEQWFVAPAGAEPAWLQRELERSDTPFRIVFMHHPPLSYGKHHDDWSNPKNGRNLHQKRQRLLKLLQEYDVRVVFAGHQHLYEHNVLSPIDGIDGAADLHVVVSGGGGSPLHRVRDDEGKQACSDNYRAEGCNVECVKQESILNYCVVSVSPDRVTIDAYEVAKKVEDTGRHVDRLIVERK